MSAIKQSLMWGFDLMALGANSSGKLSKKWRDLIGHLSVKKFDHDDCWKTTAAWSLRAAITLLALFSSHDLAGVSIGCKIGKRQSQSVPQSTAPIRRFTRATYLTRSTHQRLFERKFQKCHKALYLHTATFERVKKKASHILLASFWLVWHLSATIQYY